jgi:hypothetical protein
MITSCLFFGMHQEDRVFAVNLLDMHPDGFIRARRHVLSHIVCTDGKLPVTAVDEDGKLDRFRTSKIDELV